MIKGKTTVYVCEDTICKLPTADLEQIKRLVSDVKTYSLSPELWSLQQRLVYFSCPCLFGRLVWAQWLCVWPQDQDQFAHSPSWTDPLIVDEDYLVR